jgi:hypothetical protein
MRINELAKWPPTMTMGKGPSFATADLIDVVVDSGRVHEIGEQTLVLIKLRKPDGQLYDVGFSLPDDLAKKAALAIAPNMTLGAVGELDIS